MSTVDGAARRETRLVVFDLDGTLIDSSRDLAAAVNATLARVAPAASPLPLATVRTLIGEGARNLIARSLEQAGLDAPVQEMLPVFLECYRARLLDDTTLYPGVRETLEVLYPRRLAVLTNKPGDMSRAILEGLGVAGHFFRVYGGDDLPTRKPDPEGLLRILSEAGSEAGDAVLVGDSGVDVRTARAAGVRAVGVTYGFDPESLRREPPDIVLAEFRELPAIL